MPIRNPFTRRQAEDGALRPPLTIEPGLKTPPGFERVDTVGSKASSAISISSRQSQDTGDYKMSGTHDLSPRSHAWLSWLFPVARTAAIARLRHPYEIIWADSMSQ